MQFSFISSTHSDLADNNDNFTSFSNTCYPPIDYAAPGIGIISTRLGEGAACTQTSMAAPHVCGILQFKAVPNADGVAIDDPDGTADPSAHH
ncbi:MAG: hypothetical protein QNJ78_11300 [Gammaproteobacteria bacterium]|nr:hypothetical protein [Gammaproteobacteria bacterium]